MEIGNVCVNFEWVDDWKEFNIERERLLVIIRNVEENV